ncbi:MAG: hypothetical protein JWM64_2473 [Frankiales bacterium]|nr:hypothetical protein [Frankiales bacterium]
MPLTPEQYTDHVRAAEDAEGRLPLPGMAFWETCPFEPDGLTVARLADPELPEAPREGEDPADCRSCRAEGEDVWSDGSWRLRAVSGGVPLALLLGPHAHHDLADLPDTLAAELGVLTVHLARAVEALPHVARAHVYRLGDGGAHLHVWFFARPAGFAQLRGSFLPVWDDVLPPVPDDVRAADALAVARALAASYGGTAS